MTLEEAKKIICELDSGSGFFGSDYEAGFSDAQNRVLGILDEVDTEPVGNPDKMTLTELAQKLLGIYDFKYLTVDIKNVRLWSRKPIFQPDPYGQQFGKWVADRNGIYNKKQCVVEKLSADSMKCSLDLSEYEGEYGNTVFSKCIVEVSDES